MKFYELKRRTLFRYTHVAFLWSFVQAVDLLQLRICGLKQYISPKL